MTNVDFYQSVEASRHQWQPFENQKQRKIYSNMIKNQFSQKLNLQQQVFLFTQLETIAYTQISWTDTFQQIKHDAKKILFSNDDEEEVSKEDLKDLAIEGCSILWKNFKAIKNKEAEFVAALRIMRRGFEYTEANHCIILPYSISWDYKVFMEKDPSYLDFRKKS